jgi:hypothetical protein
MPNFTSELMRRAQTPLLPQIGEGWDKIADLINNPDSGSSNVPLQTVKGGLAGMAHGLGKVATEATSPIGLIALMAGSRLGGAGGGRFGGGGGSGIGSGGRTAAEYAEAARGFMPNLPPEFTPVGSEPQRMTSMFMDPVEAAYNRLLVRGGR